MILRVGQQRHDDSFYSTQRTTTVTSWGAAVKRTSASGPVITTSITAGESAGIPLEVYIHDSPAKAREDGSVGHSARNSEVDFPV